MEENTAKKNNPNDSNDPNAMSSLKSVSNSWTYVPIFPVDSTIDPSIPHRVHLCHVPNVPLLLEDELLELLAFTLASHMTLYGKKANRCFDKRWTRQNSGQFENVEMYGKHSLVDQSRKAYLGEQHTKQKVFQKNSTGVYLRFLIQTINWTNKYFFSCNSKDTLQNTCFQNGLWPQKHLRTDAGLKPLLHHPLVCFLASRVTSKSTKEWLSVFHCWSLKQLHCSISARKPLVHEKKTAECGKHRRKNGWTSIECTIELAQTDSRTLVCMIGQITNNLSYLFCLSRPGNLQHFSDSSVPHPWPWLWLRPWLNNPWNANCHIFIILITGINTRYLLLRSVMCAYNIYIYIYIY